MNCAKCDKELKPVFSDTNVNSQFQFSIELIFNGGYGMFTDRMGVPDYANICHDCTVGIIREFPIEFQSKFAGGHPYEGSEPCCEFGWSTSPLNNERVYCKFWEDHPEFIE